MAETERQEQRIQLHRLASFLQEHGIRRLQIQPYLQNEQIDNTHKASVASIRIKEPKEEA